MNRIKIEGRTPEEKEAYYQFKIAELINENNKLKKKLKRRENKIIKLEAENEKLNQAFNMMLLADYLMEDK